MCQISLTNLAFSPSPSGVIAVDVHVRDVLSDAGNPASWTFVSTINVDASGVIAPPIEVTVPYGSTYELRMTSACSVYFEEISCTPTTTTTTSTTTTTTAPTTTTTTTTTTTSTTTTTTVCPSITDVVWTEVEV